MDKFKKDMDERKSLNAFLKDQSDCRTNQIKSLAEDKAIEENEIEIEGG